MKNVYNIENGINKLSDGRINPTYDTTQVITLVSFVKFVAKARLLDILFLFKKSTLWYIIKV